MVGSFPTCCARAASGHAAAPPSSVMNWRRPASMTLPAASSRRHGTRPPVSGTLPASSAGFGVATFHEEATFWLSFPRPRYWPGPWGADDTYVDGLSRRRSRFRVPSLPPLPFDDLAHFSYFGCNFLAGVATTRGYSQTPTSARAVRL